MRDRPLSHELRHGPLKRAGSAVVLLAGFFALLVTAAHPITVGLFLAGASSAVVATALVVACTHKRAVCVPGTRVCLRLSAS